MSGHNVHMPCPDCGPQCVPPSAVRVHVSRVQGAGARYSFTCPTCQAWISRPAAKADIKLLLSRGSQADVVPRELLEHPERGTPAISELDVGVFAGQLDSCEYPSLVANLEKPVRP